MNTFYCFINGKIKKESEKIELDEKRAIPRSSSISNTTTTSSSSSSSSSSYQYISISISN